MTTSTWPAYPRGPKQQPQWNDEDIDDVVAFWHPLTDGDRP